MMTDAAVLAGVSQVNAAGASDRGRVRTGNEDRHYVDVARGVFLVVDGVGGHAAGEVAAAIAVDVISQRLERPLGTPAQRVREAIALANNEILRQAGRSPAHAGMTCVLTLALLSEERLTIGHVGDSRLYKLTRDGLRKLTHDHSPIGEREDAREISESDAMKHPRRSEVFRDVGSAFHEPDDADFIELIEVPFESDTAILICSDGLSDMVPSTVIQRTVTRHAGDPDGVVRELIDAANKAGGKDNITVLYVEGPGFAAANALAAGASSTRRGSIETIRASRALWLATGVLAGTLTGLALSEWLPFDTYLTSRRERTLIVGAAEDGRYPTIRAAVDAAMPGDVVQLEPGEYTERVVLKDGVDLVARVPGTATMVAPSGDPGWTIITAHGQRGNRIAGIRLLGRASAPLAVAMQLSGDNVSVDGVTIEGDALVGIDVTNHGAIAIRASRFAEVRGIPLRIGPGAQPQIQHNVFARKPSTDPAAAIHVDPSGLPSLTANVFAGYANPIQWPTAGPDVQRDNFFMRGSHGR